MLTTGFNLHNSTLHNLAHSEFDPQDLTHAGFNQHGYFFSIFSMFLVVNFKFNYETEMLSFLDDN